MSTMRFHPVGHLDVATDPGALPEQSDGKNVASGAMTRCTNLRLDEMGVAHARYGFVPAGRAVIPNRIRRIIVQGELRYAFAGVDVYQLFAEHVASSQTWVKTEGHGPVVFQWEIKPSGPDNHWFDCLVGHCAAASMCGCSLTGHGTKKRQKREPIRLSDIQSRRKHED